MGTMQQIRYCWSMGYWEHCWHEPKMAHTVYKREGLVVVACTVRHTMVVGYRVTPLCQCYDNTTYTHCNSKWYTNIMEPDACAEAIGLHYVHTRCMVPWLWIRPVGVQRRTMTEWLTDLCPGVCCRCANQWLSLTATTASHDSHNVKIHDIMNTVIHECPTLAAGQGQRHTAQIIKNARTPATLRVLFHYTTFQSGQSTPKWGSDLICAHFECVWHGNR